MRRFIHSFLFTCLIVLLSARCSPAAELPVQGIYEIRSAVNSRFVLDEKHCLENEEEASSLQMYLPAEVRQQQFYLEFSGPNNIRIVNLLSGRYLKQGQIRQDGIPKAAVDLVHYASQEEADADDELLWHMVARPDDTWLLRSSGGLYLTLPSGRAFNGAGLILTEFTGANDQKWQFTPGHVYPDLIADTDYINPYEEDGELENVQITLQFQNARETITSETLASWMIRTEDHDCVFDEEMLKAYITTLAQRYNTAGNPRDFTTSYKTTITLYKGNYGWKLDEGETMRILKEAITKPGYHYIHPVWAQKAREFNGKNSDVGDSYVEIHLTAQRVWLYKNGVQLLQTDCVSGTAGTDRETPGGVYYIFYKQAPAVLTGPGYNSPVEYWMPFNGNIGLHDASWRGSFGGDIYLTNGSHGCVNLPLEAAKKIYETVTIGYPVVCYK